MEFLPVEAIHYERGIVSNVLEHLDDPFGSNPFHTCSCEIDWLKVLPIVKLLSNLFCIPSAELLSNEVLCCLVHALSMGCRQSVQFGGSFTAWALRFSSSCVIWAVPWPLKLSNMTKAGKSSSRLLVAYTKST